MPMNTSATFAKTLKRDLSAVITDKKASMSGTRVKMIFATPSMSDAYEDDQVYSGIGKADRQGEGQNITIGTVSEGPSFRYVARKIGRRMVVTDEAIEDCKYNEAISGASNCVRAVVKAYEYDGGLFFDRAFNTDYAFGDGVPLCSASHPLASGSTYSNLLATPMAPSVGAVSQARTMARGFLSDDGLIEPEELEGVIFPKEQETDWEVLLGSKLETSNNNFSRLNIANRMKLKPMMNEFITASTTNYWFKTGAKNGICAKTRRKMKSRSWIENANETVNFSCTMRYAFGHSNARSIIGVGS